MTTLRAALVALYQSIRNCDGPLAIRAGQFLWRLRAPQHQPLRLPGLAA